MDTSGTSRTSRLRYVGVLDKRDGLRTFWRMEHSFGPRGWVPNGPILSGFIPSALLANETWMNVLQSVEESDGAWERAEMLRQGADIPLF